MPLNTAATANGLITPVWVKIKIVSEKSNKMWNKTNRFVNNEPLGFTNGRNFMKIGQLDPFNWKNIKNLVYKLKFLNIL